MECKCCRERICPECGNYLEEPSWFFLERFRSTVDGQRRRASEKQWKLVSLALSIFFSVVGLTLGLQ